jgi:hypothetical protein
MEIKDNRTHIRFKVATLTTMTSFILLSGVTTAAADGLVLVFQVNVSISLIHGTNEEFILLKPKQRIVMEWKVTGKHLQ